jgi:hypothetical protein
MKAVALSSLDVDDDDDDEEHDSDGRLFFNAADVIGINESFSI